MIYIRGDRHDYDRWASLGNRGWSYDELLPYFRRSEHFEPGESPWHGRGGELNVAAQRSRARSTRCSSRPPRKWLAVQRRLQRRAPGRHCPFHVTQVNGERCSAARAFLHPALARPNLTVLSSALTLRVLLEGTRATGGDQPGWRGRKLQARREVILSAGSINSPQLLLLSGIGPAAELARHGIVQRHELPGVGENLQDHQDIVLMYRTEAKLGYGLGFAEGLAAAAALALAVPVRPARGADLEHRRVRWLLRLDPQAETPELGLIVAPR